jgi:hypothetical protein
MTLEQPQKQNINTEIYENWSADLNVEMAEHIKTHTPWSESASELYRPSDCRLSAK